MDVSEKSVNSFKISPMFKETDILPRKLPNLFETDNQIFTHEAVMLCLDKISAR